MRRRRGGRGARRARVLVIAGLDPTGGAGLVADLDAVRSAGADAWLVASALTAQGPGGALGFEPATDGFVLDQIDALVEGRERAGAVKTGMIGSALNAAAVAARLSERPLARTPVVVDPVLAASSGASLFDPEGATAGEAFAPLLARCRVATPNLPELAALTGLDVSTEEGALRAARALPARAVLVKGGHRPGAPEDLLVEGRRVTRFSGRRRPGTARGTGCRLAAALAAYLAQGEALEEAVRRAKRLVERYLDRAVAGG